MNNTLKYLNQKNEILYYSLKSQILIYFVIFFILIILIQFFIFNSSNNTNPRIKDLINMIFDYLDIPKDLDDDLKDD